MGIVFRYVADDSLEAHRCRDLPCPLCGATADVYPFRAEPDGGYISEACLRCIRLLPLDRIVAWRSERQVAEHLRETHPAMSSCELEVQRAEICAELRRTPRVPPFVQDDTWPLCCGNFAEYIGYPGLPGDWQDLGGLSLFRCQQCGQEFEVFQHT